MPGLKPGFHIAVLGACPADRAKFGADPALRDHLLATGDEILVEAAPTDRI